MRATSEIVGLRRCVPRVAALSFYCCRQPRAPSPARSSLSGAALSARTYAANAGKRSRTSIHGGRRRQAFTRGCWHTLRTVAHSWRATMLDQLVEPHHRGLEWSAAQHGLVIAGSHLCIQWSTTPRGSKACDVTHWTALRRGDGIALDFFTIRRASSCAVARAKAGRIHQLETITPITSNIRGAIFCRRSMAGGTLC